MYAVMTTRENFRISDRESAILRLFCEQEDRGKTDVVRELIRALEDRLTPEYKQLLANVSKSSTVN